MNYSVAADVNTNLHTARSPLQTTNPKTETLNKEETLKRWYSQGRAAKVKGQGSQGQRSRQGSHGQSHQTQLHLKGLINVYISFIT